jgi:hypothetical protein
MHTQEHANHVAAHGGWNRAVKTSAGSWDDGEDPGGVRRSCGGTKVYISDLKKKKSDLNTTVELRTAPLQGVERGQRGPTR